MKTYLNKAVLSASLFILTAHNANAQYSQIESVSTTKDDSWVVQKSKVLKSAGAADVELVLTAPLQTVEGFGACFNELGWTSLKALAAKDRDLIMRELFEPGYGANFNICRMPLGANDFSRDWYSYDENEGDFGMNKFSISNDLETLVPFIKNALQYNPKLKLWASPWSPPSWMKWNKHYACQVSGAQLDEKFQNRLDEDKEGKEGTNMFIQKPEYLKAYALYFSKFIEAYHKEGISVSAVMPQNEFNSCQIFPSCTWTASALRDFIGKYLGPEMEKQNVEIMFGTMERPNKALADTVLTDPAASRYVRGAGFQWAGKEAVAGIHKRYPGLKLYQSEQECGDGKNDWKYCCYTWELLKRYFTSGVNAYMYWNIALEEKGFSRWGWQQNSLITVDSASKSYKFNYEYYLMKHFSHYIKPGARLLQTKGQYKNLLAFLNPDTSIVIVCYNDANESLNLTFKAGDRQFSSSFKPSSFSTVLVR